MTDIYKLGFRYSDGTANFSDCLWFVFKNNLKKTNEYLNKKYATEHISFDFTTLEQIETYIFDVGLHVEDIIEDINTDFKDIYIHYVAEHSEFYYEMYEFDEEKSIKYFCEKYPHLLNEETVNKILARAI